MRKSARYLGYGLGINAQTMNQLLKNQDYLSGEPGCYELTEKGIEYCVEEYHSRGNGGYAYYNRAWTTRRWDEDILEDMDTSHEAIEQAKADVKARREKLRAKRLVENAVENVSPESDKPIPTKMIIFLVLVICLIPLVIYWLVEYVIPWISDKFDHSSNEKNVETSDCCEAEASIMICPACGGHFLEYPRARIWLCSECSFRLSFEEVQNSELWYCDNCGAFLNSQIGFDKAKNTVICEKCGFESSLLDDADSSDE